MPPPRVSVHVVTYNQRGYIADTIESALGQDYGNLQIVVADDGSTDGTREIVETYASRHPGRVLAITGGPNLGITGNGNRCLARCAGDYVAFLAGDDLMLPGKIRAQVDWFEADPGRVLCAHDVEHFDSTTGGTLMLHSAISPQRSGSGAYDFLKRGYYSATSSIMVRSTAMPSRGFDERIRIHSDWKFAVECVAKGGKFGYVPGVLGRYRRHGQNATVKYSALAWEEIHVSIALLEVEYPELTHACEAARAYAFYQRGVALLQSGDENGARRALWNATRHDPTISWKLPLWTGISYLPFGALPATLRRRLGMSRR